MVAHHMISSTLLPAASRLTPSRQTARHPFSFLQSFLNKLDVVTNAPLRHVQLREASACCSPGGLCPVAPGVLSGAASRSWACSEDSVLPLLQPKGCFCFLHFFLPALIHYWEETYSQKKSTYTLIQQVKGSTAGKKLNNYTEMSSIRKMEISDNQYVLNTIKPVAGTCVLFLISQLIPTTNNYTLLPHNSNRFTLFEFYSLPPRQFLYCAHFIILSRIYRFTSCLPLSIVCEEHILLPMPTESTNLFHKSSHWFQSKSSQSKLLNRISESRTFAFSFKNKTKQKRGMLCTS